MDPCDVPVAEFERYCRYPRAENIGNADRYVCLWIVVAYKVVKGVFAYDGRPKLQDQSSVESKQIQARDIVRRCLRLASGWGLGGTTIGNGRRIIVDSVFIGALRDGGSGGFNFASLRSARALDSSNAKDLHILLVGRSLSQGDLGMALLTINILEVMHGVTRTGKPVSLWLGELGRIQVYLPSTRWRITLP